MSDYLEFSYDEAKVKDIISELSSISSYLGSNNLGTLISNLKSKTGWNRVSNVYSNIGVIEQYKKDYQKSINGEKNRISDTLSALTSFEGDVTVTETKWWADAGMAIFNFAEGFLTGFEQIVDGLMTGAAVVCGWLNWSDAEQWLTDAVRYEVVASATDWAFENVPFMAAIEKHASYNHDDPAADFMKGAGTVVAYVAIAAMTGGTQGLSAAVADAAFTFVGELGAGTQEKLIADPNMSIQDAAAASVGDAAFAAGMAFTIGYGLELVGPFATKAVKGVGQKVTQHMAKEAGEKLLKETAEKTIREGAEALAKEGAEKAGKELTEKLIKEGGEKAVKEASEQAIKEAGEKALKEAGQELTEDAIKEAGEKAIREAGEKAAKEAAEKAGKELTEKTIKEAGEKALQEAGEKGIKETSEKLLKEPAEKPIRESAEKAARESAEKAGKEFSE